MKKDEPFRGFLQVFAGALKIAENCLAAATTRMPYLQRLKPVRRQQKQPSFRQQRSCIAEARPLELDARRRLESHRESARGALQIARRDTESAQREREG